MVVAVRAVKGEAEESLASVFDYIAHPLVWVERIPVSDQITRGHARLVVIGRDFIGGEHLGEHAVIALVSVE